MAVLAPLNRADALDRLHDAGVEEVYVGFHDEAWDERFGPADLNRMSGFGKEANPFSFPRMCEQLQRADELGMRAFVCFNASQYSAEQLDFIAREYVPNIAQSRGTGIIVSSQGLLTSIREAGMQAVVSTVAGVFNARLAEHYRARGATRLILPRDLSSAEIAGIVRAVPDLEYEVFLMRNGCVFSDSHCLGRHCAGKPSLCLSLREGQTVIWPVSRIATENAGPVWNGWHENALWEAARSLPNNATAYPFDDSTLTQDKDGESEDRLAWHGESGDRAPSPSEGSTWLHNENLVNVERERAFIDAAYENERIWAERYHRRTCGLCALWRFEQLGIAAYKVVGRGDDVDDLVADAGLVARNTELARACATEDEYLARMELPRDPATLCDNEGLSCYYPELHAALHRA